MLCFPVQSLPPCFWTDCCVIGLQSTGEAAANDATKKAGVTDEAMMDGFVSAPQQALRKTILSVFPPAPKPRGVIAPDFIYPKMDVLDDVVMADDASESESEVEDLPWAQ